MLRFISTFLLLNSAMWLVVLRWRRQRRPERVWTRWLVVWGAWILFGWIAMIVHTAVVLRFIG